jgi:hypothetical protein
LEDLDVELIANGVEAVVHEPHVEIVVYVFGEYFPIDALYGI